VLVARLKVSRSLTLAEVPLDVSPIISFLSTLRLPLPGPIPPLRVLLSSIRAEATAAARIGKKVNDRSLAEQTIRAFFLRSPPNLFLLFVFLPAKAQRRYPPPCKSAGDVGRGVTVSVNATREINAPRQLPARFPVVDGSKRDIRSSLSARKLTLLRGENDDRGRSRWKLDKRAIVTLSRSRAEVADFALESDRCDRARVSID
jgi:hypothetical protein